MHATVVSNRPVNGPLERSHDVTTSNRFFPYGCQLGTI